MKMIRVHFARLFALGLVTAFAAACGGSTKEPETPKQKRTDDSKGYTEDEVRDSAEWR